MQNAADRIGCVSAQCRLPLPLAAEKAPCRGRQSTRTSLSTRDRRDTSDVKAESEECVSKGNTNIRVYKVISIVCEDCVYVFVLA